MGDERFVIVKAGKYDTIPLFAALRPDEYLDWWVGSKAHQVGSRAGAAVGALHVDAEHRWARQQFEHGAVYIVLTPDFVGPFWIDAPIDAAYFQPAEGDLSATGGPFGALGAPLGDSTNYVDGGRASAFANGNIYWWPDVGARVLSPDLVDVRFDRIHCFSETSGPGSDEPYLVLTTVSTEGQRSQLVSFDEVDAGGSHRRDVTLYHGPPSGLYVVGALFEHDEGDREAAKEAASHVVEAAGIAIEAGLHLIPGIGTALGVGVAIFEKLLAGPIASLVSDALGLEDDSIGASAAVLASKELIVAATDAQLIGGARNAAEELRFRGDGGGDYAAYLTVYQGRRPIPLLPGSGSALAPGQTLTAPASLHSADQAFTLTYQGDGNLVLYRNADRHAVWSSETWGAQPGVCIMQTDGNLVVYDADVRPRWASGSMTSGSSLSVASNGTLVIHGPDGKTVWHAP